MAKEHTNRTMVQRALDGELESNKEAVLQKIGCKRNKRSSHLLIEQLDLNMALIEVYQELAKMTRVAKDMASSNKQAANKPTEQQNFGKVRKLESLTSNDSFGKSPAKVRKLISPSPFSLTSPT